MTPGEVKGFLKQLRMRAVTDEEREAVDFALEAMRLMLVIAPTISKVNKLNDELRETKVKNVKDSSRSSWVSPDVINSRGDSQAEPNTGWICDDVPPDRTGSK